MKFHHDTAKKGLEAITYFFLSMTSAITLSEISEICPFKIPSETFMVQMHTQDLNEIR